MSSPIVDQPPPVPTGRRPSWEIVISYVQSTAGPARILDLVLADMRERDQVGRQRYGTPLTSGNGRDHLVDALQEQLDSAVYLATALDEHGVGPDTQIDESLIPDSDLRYRLFCVQDLFADQVRSLIKLRALIEERAP